MSDTVNKTKIVRISEDEHRKAKTKAAASGKTLQQYLDSLIEKDTETASTTEKNK